MPSGLFIWLSCSLVAGETKNASISKEKHIQCCCSWCKMRNILCLFVANSVCQWAGEWGWEQGWGCGQRKLTHGLWLVAGLS